MQDLDANPHTNPSNSLISKRNKYAPLFRAFVVALATLIVLFLLFGGGDDSATTDATPTATPTSDQLSVEVPNADPNATLTLPTTPANPVDTFSSTMPGLNVTIQVLKGNDTPEAAYQDAIATLQNYGYTVKSGTTARSKYPETTIFSVPGYEQQANALKAHDSRFAKIVPKPANIKAPDMIHAAIGTDWQVGGDIGTNLPVEGQPDSTDPNATAQIPADGTTGTTIEAGSGQTGLPSYAGVETTVKAPAPSTTE